MPGRQYQQQTGIGVRGGGGAQIRTIEPCILCKGDHGLWKCPKIEDVKKGILKMPQNVCYQHCNVKGPQCQNPCKGLLTYNDRKGGTREIDVLCREHGKFHQQLCRMGNCKEKVFTEQRNKAPKTKRNQINVIQHINIVKTSDVVNKTHTHDSIFAPAENTKYLMEHILAKTKSNNNYPIIIYYDTLASCSLLNDGDNHEVRDLLDMQEQSRTEIVRFAGCNSESVNKDVRVLEVMVIGKNKNITVQCFAKKIPSTHCNMPSTTGKIYTP